MAMILEKRATETTLDIAKERAGAAPETLPDAELSLQEARTVLRVPTTRFGTIEAEEDLIITFPDGLIGFESLLRYVVVHSDESSAFRWLQALDSPAVAFPVLEPRQFRPDYAPMISDADARFLELTETTPALTFVIVTVPSHNPRAMTANLLGPLVINVLTRRGKQVIVQDEGFTTRHEIMEELNRAANVAIVPSSGTNHTRVSGNGRKR